MLQLFSRFIVVSLLSCTLCLSGCSPALIKVRNDVQNFIQKLSGEQSACNTEKGVQLLLNKSTLQPDIVRRSEEITVSMVYEIVCAPESGLSIREEKTLWYGGKKLTILTNEEAYRQNGTWESSITFHIPKSAQSGRYELRQDMYSGNDVLLSTANTFTLSD